eukprot:scaffold3735_cov161-Skeletonema_dohrnii-CCMP3373.AAC.1
MEHVSSPRNNARLPLFRLMYIVISVLVPSHVHLQEMTDEMCCGGKFRCPIPGIELSDGRSKQFHTYSAAACIYLAQQAVAHEKDEGMSLIWREMCERHVADNT